MREAVFNALGSLDAVEGAVALDLFAGSGALGIEALSRGAERVTFVDLSPEARGAVEENLGATGLVDAGVLVAADAEAFLGSCPDRFDLVLLDPPYAFDRWSQLLLAVEKVAADGLVVIESDRPVDLPFGWRVERAKRYGGTLVTIARPSSSPSEPL